MAVFVLSQRIGTTFSTISAHALESEAWDHAMKLIPAQVRDEMGMDDALAKSWSYFTAGEQEFYVQRVPIVRQEKDISDLLDFARKLKVTNAELEDHLERFFSEKFDRANLNFESQIRTISEQYSDQEAKEILIDIKDHRAWLRVI